jgi:hypothetical protein
MKSYYFPRSIKVPRYYTLCFHYDPVGGPWVPGPPVFSLQIVTLSAGAARDLALPPVSKMRFITGAGV